MSIEERYDEVRQLIALGKNNGYLLYDEVNELLPSAITSSDELDELFDACGNAGIEIIDSEQKHLRDEIPLDRISEAAEEGEVTLARRIERGRRAILTSIARTPLIAKKVIALGDQLHSSDRTIRELVIFNHGAITDERLQERSQQQREEQLGSTWLQLVRKSAGRSIH